jgi:aspartyl-tRNA(Asn)/glutamyl-tRNA(Gln) amidotransferase subunit A
VPLHRSLLELRALLRGGLDPVVLIQETLAAIDAAEVRLNAFVAVHREAAAAVAAAVRDAGGEAGGTLAGLPVAVKDNFDEAGVPSSGGCKAYRDRVPAADAAVVARLRAAGAVVVGRTNMHELANGVTSENPHHGPVHNPWRHGYQPGGSSGGSAAAVAAGVVAAALGTDTGGSVRIPAALCGAVGFKPTAGLVPTAGVLPLSSTLDHVGPITRTVPDAAALLDAIATRGGYLTACRRWAGSLRVGVLEAFGGDADAGVAAVFATALRAVEAAGYRLQPLRVPGLGNGVRLLSRIYRPEASAAHAEQLAARPDDFGADVRAELERGLKADPAKHEAALADREALRVEVAAAMAEVDLLVCPTTPCAAKPIGATDAGVYLTYTCPFNATGQPALSVPMGFVDGLPVGLQVIGRAGEDDRVLCAGAAIERRLGFGGSLLPPV